MRRHIYIYIYIVMVSSWLCAHQCPHSMPIYHFCLSHLDNVWRTVTERICCKWRATYYRFVVWKICQKSNYNDLLCVDGGKKNWCTRASCDGHSHEHTGSLLPKPAETTLVTMRTMSIGCQWIRSINVQKRNVEIKIDRSMVAIIAFEVLWICTCAPSPPVIRYPFHIIIQTFSQKLVWPFWTRCENGMFLLLYILLRARDTLSISAIWIRSSSRLRPWTLNIALAHTHIYQRQAQKTGTKCTNIKCIMKMANITPRPPCFCLQNYTSHLLCDVSAEHIYLDIRLYCSIWESVRTILFSFTALLCLLHDGSSRVFVSCTMRGEARRAGWLAPTRYESTCINRKCRAYTLSFCPAMRYTLGG